MKRIILAALGLALISPMLLSFDKKKKKEEATATTDAKKEETKEIKWMSIEQAQVAMKAKPKKVLIDVYTDWCGWCKVMDKKTFTNPNVIAYINEHFYAVKLDAEQKDSIRFQGKSYGFQPEMRANEFAVNLLQGSMSFPTTVIMGEEFANPQPIPGYLDVKTMETILKYINEGHFKNTPFPTFQAEYKPSWDK